MQPKLMWANLAVSDLAQTIKFYSDLGFKANGDHTSKELTSFFFGADKFVINFFLKEVLQANTGIEIADPKKMSEVMFTLSAASKEQVDDWESEIEPAGGKILSKPRVFGKGYYGFDFADPDGHRFNVFYMEGL